MSHAQGVVIFAKPPIKRKTRLRAYRGQPICFLAHALTDVHLPDEHEQHKVKSSPSQKCAQGIRNARSARDIAGSAVPLLEAGNTQVEVTTLSATIDHLRISILTGSYTTHTTPRSRIESSR